MRDELIREIRITLQLKAVSLEGHLAIPENPLGIIAFAHGSGSSRHSPRNRLVARRLSENHLATLLFDLLTEEEQVTEQASGQLRFDIPLLGGRLSETIDAIKRQPDVAGLSIGLFGASTGAAAALVSAALRPYDVAAVVSRGGRPDLASQSLRQVLAPTLLIVGEIDDPVIELNQRAYEELKTDKRLEIVRGATHLFEEPGTLENVANQASRWFVRHLGGQSRLEHPMGSDREGESELSHLNKRAMIQSIIDDEPEPWIIMKPSRKNPTDPEDLCIFENPAAQTRACTRIPLAWFRNREMDRIKRTIQESLGQAQVIDEEEPRMESIPKH
jgi:dienelactone hydrolase